MFKRFITSVLCLTLVVLANAQQKREFRGAWIQCVNGQFQGLGTEKTKENLTHQLDELQKDGANAIIFQVRPACDALYQSNIEPWSHWLTGQQGTPPSPYWDPLQWMITECHKRGMELHAWINPFRARSKNLKSIAVSHVCIKHPELVFQYNGSDFLNPARQENRDYICNVVADIVKRYDVDGIHYDDYFYPYPAEGCEIPDQKDFDSDPRGFRNIKDWRRDNVTLFVKQLYTTVHDIKPWVKVGVSPFGIWRNKKNDPDGSDTNGLQNYDQLYADILTWVNNGYVDYCVPQLYWQIGHPAADYETLIKWWNMYCGKRPLFIGEDIERTVKYHDLRDSTQNQMRAKYNLHAQLPHVQGTVLWYSRTAVDNIGNYGKTLRDFYWHYPALQPTMPFINNTVPGKVKKIKPLWTKDGYILFWQTPKYTSWQDEAVRFVVYRFNKNEEINIKDPKHIITITNNAWYNLPYVDGKEKYIYVITALNRLSNEGEWVKKKVKL